MKQKTNSPLRNIRRTRTISQAELARLVGVTQETISKVERGIFVPRPDVQARIAAILGVARAEAFPASDQEEASTS